MPITLSLSHQTCPDSIGEDDSHRWLDRIKGRFDSWSRVGLYQKTEVCLLVSGGYRQRKPAPTGLHWGWVSESDDGFDSICGQSVVDWHHSTILQGCRGRFTHANALSFEKQVSLVNTAHIKFKSPNLPLPN